MTTTTTTERHISMSTILHDRSDTTMAEFTFDIDPEGPAKPVTFDPTEGMALPSFEDPTTSTVAWLTDKGAVEVSVDRWLNGDIHRAAFSAERSGVTGVPLPEWITVEVFFAERVHVAPVWEILSDLSTDWI